MMTRTQLLAFIGIISFGTVSAAADDIALRQSVRLAPGRTDVRLGDIADLQGADARAMADVIVLAKRDPAKRILLSIQDIRDTLSLAGAHWGRVNLSGGSVTIAASRDADVGPVTPMTPISIDAAPAAEVEPREIVQGADKLINQPTLGGMVARLVTSRLRMDPAHVRIAVDAHEAALWNATPDESRFELEPLGSAISDRVEFIIRKWGAGGVESRQTLSVRPLLLTTTVAPNSDIERGASILEQDLDANTSWISPAQAAALATPADVVGRVAGKRLRAGEAIRKQYVRSTMIIERGDRAMVRCLVGGVVIAVQAEAMADGGRGDSIEFRKLGERRTFIATITGPGEAVVDLGKTHIASAN